tara:strand:+ start:503 stop:1999 length:1497 start_codon:yes stop_codon:yes gene_type:complete
MKIPTFTATARPTAQAAGVTSNVQVDPRQNVASALRPLGKAAEDYYVRERAIEDKVNAGELSSKARVDIFNAEQQAQLKLTPSAGVEYFENEYEKIKNKYLSQTNNKNVADLFTIGLAQNKKTYVNNILKVTRNSLVKNRVGQVEQKVASDILAAVSSGDPYSFKTLSKSSLDSYQGLVNDGIIGKPQFDEYKKQFPKLVEIEQVRFLAQTDAAGAAVALQDPNNFRQITGDDRKKLITEVRSKARFDGEVLKFNNASVINKNLKAISDRINGSDANKVHGLTEQELLEYSTGDLKADEQIKSFNTKINDGKFSYDSNYNTNTTIIEKINLGEITNAKDQFKLPGETTAKSIIERAGDGQINDNDLNFLSTFITRTYNNTFSDQDKQYIQWFDNLTPLLQGNVFLSYFDKTYNNKSSKLRQVYYKRYVDGLRNGVTIENLLSPNSESYIAKDIKNLLPKTSDLGSIVKSIAEETNQSEVPPRLEGETALEYEKRTMSQ